ncbi:MAG: T9SS type A sorting domain-containing protein [Bacteroidota bacterium]
MKHLFSLLFILSISYLAHAQISTPGTPPSELYTLSTDVDKHYMPSFDLNRLIEEDIAESRKGGVPPRFGHKMEVKISPKEYGTWEELPDGGRVWRLTVTSYGARSLNFLFSKFEMPRGGEFYLYNEDKSYQIGAFTMLNNKEDGVFATAPVKGESVTIEYYEPAYSRKQGKIVISHVVHAYKNLFATAHENLEKGFGDSGSCNNDVACSNTATTCIDPSIWGDQIRSVAMIVVNGFRACTGAMINNAEYDGTPYFLSANHCGTNINNTWVFVFNYDSPSCSGPDGSLSDSVTGGALRANYGPSDVALFELSMPPPASYIAYYAGWNKSSTPPPNSVGIHHPSGDVKKISFNCDALYRGDWPGPANVPNGDHWIVGQWEDGTTEGGSSGSPLFDENQLIVGQLHGGSASCGSITYDSYGGVFASWNGGGSPSSRLSDWLDPNGICVNDTVQGAYFIDPPLTINMEAVEISGASGDFCDQNIVPSVTVRNIGATDITSFTLEYQYDGGTVMTENWSGSALGFFQSVTIDLPVTMLATGNHTFDVTVTNPNGMLDNDTSNDSATSNFGIVDGNTLTIELLTDNFPEETSYEIQELDGTVLHSVTSFADAATLYLDDFCLADGCYNFVIFDAYEDGICCGQWGDGSYTLIDENGSELITGGEFTGPLESVQFCLPFADLTAGFTVEDIYCIGETVTPIDASANATEWTWTATGADVASHSGQTPSWSYSSAGTYTIDLMTGDGMGGSADASTTITVVANPNPPAQMAGPTTSTQGALETYAVPPSPGSTYNWTVTGGTQTSGGNTNIAGVVFDNDASEAEVCIVLVNADGCESAPLCTTVALETTSIENVIEVTGLNIYPNPTSSVIYVESRHRADRIEVYNVIGQSLISIDEPQLNNFIELPKAEGIYFVRVTFEGVSVAKKILVRR